MDLSDVALRRCRFCGSDDISLGRVALEATHGQMGARPLSGRHLGRSLRRSGRLAMIRLFLATSMGSFARGEASCGSIHLTVAICGRG